jgi:tRNA-(ms[2]io[6]A)-hydroxylase
MKLSIDVRTPSPDAWLEAVLHDFDSFLQDHAECERKASSMAMSLVAKYPDKTLIIPDLIDTAVEELEHFQQVYQVMMDRNVQLRKEMTKDPYVNLLLKHMKDGIEARFLDRLLLGSVVECRGAERFKMIADHLEEPELKVFYKQLWTSEAKHGHIFVKLALHYFDEDQVYNRLNEWMDIEAEVIPQLAIQPALH